MEYELKKKKNILIVGILSLLIILMGSTYAFFSYSKGSEAYVLSSSKISAIFTSGTNSITFSNAYPISDQFALNNLDKLTYIDFTVASEVENETQAVEYEIYLTESDTNTLSSDYLKVYLTNQNNKQVVAPTIYSSLENSTYDNTGKVIFKDNNPGLHSKNYRLYVWLDQEYSQNEVSQVFSFKVNLYAYNAKAIYGSDLLKDVIYSRVDANNNSLVAEEDTDGTIYISGKQDDYNKETTDDIDFNYVWYSGKLWRITAIHPDGAMKMITEDLLTAIYWGADTTYSTSWVREWLNQEFLPTLYNYENIIVTDYEWNATQTESHTSAPSETTMVRDAVGMLNAYEYYRSYKKLGTDATAYGSGYLNVGYYWWLITPYNSSYVRSVGSVGNLNDSSPSSSTYGVRPSINLKSTIKMGEGDGSYNNPYTIMSDNEEAVNSTTLLNTRQSGEYVKIENDMDTKRVFRIVGNETISDSVTTKLVLNDYLKNGETVLEKKFSNDYTYGDGTSDSYWDYYLNNTYLATFDSSLLEQGTYYLGLYGSATSYKTTVCSSVDSNVSVTSCIKNANVVDSKWTGYIGLLRVGEMFSSQNDAPYNWLITPYSSSNVRIVGYDGTLRSNSPSLSAHGVRPSINLKSTIVIKSGSGTEQDPFIVGLPTA